MTREVHASKRRSSCRSWSPVATRRVWFGAGSPIKVGTGITYRALGSDAAHTHRVDNTVGQLPYRRLQRAFGIVLLLIALAAVSASFATTHWALMFFALFPGTAGLFVTIAYKPGATPEWAHRWFR